MKRKFSKILGIGLALALLASMLVMAVPVAADTTGPVLASIAFGDADSSTDISGGDTLTFTFTEATAMLTSTITSANINTVLATSGGHGYGTADSGLMLAWNTALKVLTVTLGNDFDLVSGETVNPTDAVTDVMGNPDETVTPQAITDNVSPTLDSIAWTDVDSSKAISATDTLAFTFSEEMKTSTVTAANVDTALLATSSHTYGSGATVAWSAGDTVVTVTLGTALAIVSGDTVNPANAVTDVATNADASSAVTIDGTMPTLSTLVWADVDSSTDISATDTLVFTFSETMNASTVTAANVDTALPITGTGTTYGTTATAAWSTNDTIMTVTLGTGVDIVSGDTVNPAATVTDMAGLADATTAGKAITDGVGPTLDSITWTDTDASTDISGTDTLVFTFSEAMATSTVTTANINVVLATSGTHTFYYGTVTNGLALSWSGGGTVLTVTVGSDVEAAGGETVNPTAAVTDVATNADATAAGVALGSGQIWVDDGYSATGYNDGHTWDTDAFDTIEEGTDIVAIGGTVNVAPGTYTLANTINISTAGITLQSTGTTAATIIDADALDSGGFDGAAIYINNAAEVTVDGFTIEDAGACGIYLGEADDAIVKNNVITNTAAIIGIDLSPTATGVTVEGNTLDEFSSLVVHSSSNTITGNAAGRDIIIAPLSSTLEDTTITNNTFPALSTEAVNGGIQIWGDSAVMATVKDTLIEGNTTSGRDAAGIRIGSSYGDKLTVEDLTITDNDIINNPVDGIYISANVTWASGNTINNNNIYNNVRYGINNDGAEIIDAESNWWGDATGPYVSTNSAATGDPVTATVDYRPWLTAEYGVEEVTTIDIASGWNFISVPKGMATATDTFGELFVGITTEASYSYDPAGGWSLLSTDTPIEVLEGYWVDVTTAGTVTLSYEGAAQEVPASKSLVGDAWNAIGFSSTTARDADTTLMSIQGSWSTVLGWDAEGQAYEDSIIATGAGDMSPGKGYWIWMTEADVLSAISG